MKIQTGLIMNDDFLPCFIELMKREMPIKQCVAMSRSIEEISRQKVAVERVKQAFAAQFAEKDEKSGVLLKDNIIQFSSEQAKQAYIAKYNEALMETFDIPLEEKIKIFEDEMFTPYKYALLQDVIEIVKRN